MGSEGQQDIEMSILTALLKGNKEYKTCCLETKVKNTFLLRLKVNTFGNVFTSDT